MKRRIDDVSSSEEKSGRKRKKKRRIHKCSSSEEIKMEGRKRPRESENSATSERGSELKRPRVEEELPLPVAISNCTIHAELGSGTYGRVWLVSLQDRIQHMAIKVIKKSNTNTSNIITEARVLKTAAGCPYICSAYGSFQTQGHVLHAMEYVSGGTLWSVIKNSVRLENDLVRFYAAELVCGLQFLHSNGIIHRDLKPSNVLVTNEGHIKIADFGLAAEGIFGNKKIRGRKGTPAFMAPEMLKKEKYNTGIDWWSLGITIYKMASGTLPFKEGKAECRPSILLAEPCFPEWFSAELQDLLQRLLKKDPKERLGLNGNIREHPFFNTIDWAQLESQNVQPPSQPVALSSVDLSKTYKEPPSFLESLKHNISSGDVSLQDMSCLESISQCQAVSGPSDTNGILRPHHQPNTTITSRPHNQLGLVLLPSPRSLNFWCLVITIVIIILAYRRYHRLPSS
eukprot:XP_017950365.1 PREDICTED: protein kinase C delta type-like [Xenopus tropicalis]